jgi:hypothetical protein
MGKTLDSILLQGLGFLIAINTYTSADSLSQKKEVLSRPTPSLTEKNTFFYSPNLGYTEGMYKDSINTESIYTKIPKPVWEKLGITPEQARYSMLYLFPSKGMDGTLSYLFQSDSSQKIDPVVMGMHLSNLSSASRAFKDYFLSHNLNIKGGKK